MNPHWPHETVTRQKTEDGQSACRSQSQSHYVRVRGVSKSTWNIRYITSAPTKLGQRKLEMIMEAKT